MRSVVIADDDSKVGHLEDVDVDLLISVGDLWDSTIQRARDLYEPRHVFAVRGNHDSAAPFPSGVLDLHLNVIEHKGIRFGGFKGSWKYKPRGHHMFEQAEVEEALRFFPAVDVFVAHNSPAEIHERDSDVHRGFVGFVDYIDRVQPSYFLHGHQHINQISQRGKTTVQSVFGEALIEMDIGTARNSFSHSR